MRPHFRAPYKLRVDTGCRPYDAASLELALRLGLPFAKLDEDLFKAAKRAGVKRLA